MYCISQNTVTHESAKLSDQAISFGLAFCKAPSELLFFKNNQENAFTAVRLKANPC
jgi:hypothetical protein